MTSIRGADLTHSSQHQHAVEWKTETTDRTDATVRMLFVKEIKMHHAEVVAAEHRRLMREKREGCCSG
jgi:hypothetical protein